MTHFFPNFSQTGSRALLDLVLNPLQKEEEKVEKLNAIKECPGGREAAKVIERTIGNIRKAAIVQTVEAAPSFSQESSEEKTLQMSR